MRSEPTALTPWLLAFTLAAACTSGTTGDSATGSTGEVTDGASSTSTGTTGDPTTTDASGTTTDASGTTTAPTTTDLPSTTAVDPIDPVEEHCQGLDFPPDAPAELEQARWTAPMQIRVTSAEDYLCGEVDPEDFEKSCTSGIFINADFPAPIVPGEYVGGQDVSLHGISAIWDQDCLNGGYGEFQDTGTMTIYAVTETCIAGAVVVPDELIEVRFLAPKCL